jgi:hypothetical protein
MEGKERLKESMSIEDEQIREAQITDSIVLWFSVELSRRICISHRWGRVSISTWTVLIRTRILKRVCLLLAIVASNLISSVS